MFIETWRWRFVVFCLGLGLLWTGGYCLLNPHEVPLNICYSPNSVFLQRLNFVASIATFLAVASGGGGLIYLVGHSVRKGLAITEDRPPLDYWNVGKSILAHLAILIALALCLLLAQYILKATRPPPPEARPIGVPRNSAER